LATPRHWAEIWAIMKPSFMISHLSGTVLYKDHKILVVDCGGVGYKVSPTTSPLFNAKLGAKIDIWTFTVVREDVLDLYGFESKEELDFFELLLSVSGIGPKSALNILSLASVNALSGAITTGDTAHLTKVSGISKKNADKIVLELKGKLKTDIEHTGFKDEVDVIEALKALGYNHRDAREAIKDLPAHLSVSDKIKLALKTLGK
jgi:Holliday junction DNA helicase RuvA